MTPKDYYWISHSYQSLLSQVQCVSMGVKLCSTIYEPSDKDKLHIQLK